MPTTQVIPSSESDLQDIANSLWKSRKVVVITGAGISTNSGIPDFRSEGGLYSLIQEQFDAAAAENEININCDSDDCDTSLELDRNRPAKRRRLSRDNLEIKSRQSRNGDSIAVAFVEEEVVAEIECAGDSDTSGLSEEDASKAVAIANHSAVEVATQEDVIMVDSELQDAPDPSDEPPGGAHRGPSTPFKTLPATVDELTALTPLPSPFISRPAAHRANGNAGPLTSSPPSLTHDNSRFPSDSDQSFPHTVSSSPLSSPPHFLLDPYQQPSRRASGSPSPSSSQGSSSSGLESDDSGRSSSSTPVLTSQSSYTSFANRNSLPTMKGKDLFDAQIWSCPKQTSVFYTFITSLRQKVREAEPTTTHRFVGILRDSRKLVRCYTQNIDQLEERVGLSTSLELGPGSRYRFSARSGRTSGGARGPIKETEASTLSQTDAMEETKQSEDGMCTPSGTQAEAESQSTSVNDGDTLEPSSQAKENEIPLSQVSNTTAKAPPNRGVECVCVHGSLAQLRCFVCGRTASWDEESRELDTLAGRQPQCPHCERATAAREERGKRALGVGKLRPNIVLYGEAHPQDHLIEQVVRHDLSLGPDMLLILGTSLRVHGLKTLVREFAKAVHDRGGKVVFVNFTKPPDSVWSDFIDYWVQWDCDAWVSDIEKRKPALWLPPGTSLPEEEKPRKATKASRKSGAGETSKIKDDSTVTKSRRSTAAIGRKGRPKKEASSITVSASLQEEAEIVAAGPEITVAGDLVEETPGQQPLPSDTETISPEVVVAPQLELTEEVVAPDKPVIEREEAVSANTIPSSDSPPGQGSYPDSHLSQPQEVQVTEPRPLDSPPFLPPADSTPVSPPQDSSKAAPPSGRRAKTSSAVAQPSFSSSSPTTTSSVPDQPSTLLLVISSHTSHVPAEGMAPPETAYDSAPPQKAAKTRKDPDAPRPIILRDDKLNGAYLTWKIHQELRRITGQPPLVFPTYPSTIRTGSMAPPPPKQSKRSRKSAPAALAGRGQEASAALENAVEDQPTTAEQVSDHPAPGAMPNMMPPSIKFGPVPNPRPVETNAGDPVEPESSISALVKNRKRKRQSWKMVRGVEVLVDLDAEEAEAAKCAEQEEAAALPAPKSSAEAPKRRLTHPPPRVSAEPAQLALEDGFSSTDRLIAKLNSELEQFSPAPASNNAVHKIDTAAGFSETDRLIALASRPSTPVLTNNNRQLTLAPLQIHNAQNQNQAPGRHQHASVVSATQRQARPSMGPDPAHRPRPEPIEPKVLSPGPETEIAPSVGSPPAPAQTLAMGSQGIEQALRGNQRNMAMPMMHANEAASGNRVMNANGPVTPTVSTPVNGPMDANLLMAGRNPMHVQAMLNNGTMMPVRNMGDNGMNNPAMTMMTNNQGRNAFYYEDPMVRRLRYPPLWLEQSYNQSQFAVRTTPIDHQVEEVGETHPAAPGQGGFGRRQSAAGVITYGPEDQLRREQEAAMVMSMMGRQRQQSQAPMPPQPRPIPHGVTLFVDDSRYVRSFPPGQAPAQANPQAGY